VRQCNAVVKPGLCLGILASSMLFCSRNAEAQLVDTADVIASRIFDVPGNSGLDPDETLEYLDELSTLTGNDLERLHADADVSWSEARRELRAKQYHPFTNDSSGSFSLRSRVSSPLDPEEQPAYANSEYLGGPTAFYNRILARSPMIDVSALEQKQSGEQSFTDHLTGFAEIRNSVPIIGSLSLEKALVGDYTLAFGNGLLFGGGLASAKSLHAATGVEERSFGLRGTVNEANKTLEGAAVELDVGPSHILVFASDRPFDADVVNDSIKTIYSSTYHRTQSEIAAENATSAQLAGARVEIATADTANLYFKAGATVCELNYNHPFVDSPSVTFIGSQLGLAGADMLAMSGNWTALAEAAHSANDTSAQTALLFSTIFNPEKYVALSLSYQHIPYRFQSPFGEIGGTAASSLSNLDGYYVGVELAPIPNRLRMNAYAQFESELVPLGDLFGNEKHDYLADASFRATDELELKATARDQENASVVSDNGTVTLPGQTLNLRLEAAYNSGNDATLRTRFEHIHYSLTTKEDGWQASEEVKIKMPSAGSELTTTLTRFETASSNSAISSYEIGSPGTATINSLDGLGWRVAVRGTVHATHAFAISAYLAGTVYDVPRTIGSGAIAYTGTSTFSATAQIDVKL
jgi:hypothetical protein